MYSRGGRRRARGLDRVVEQITAGARTEDEQLRAFFEVISETVALPCRAYVIDVPVSARSVVYDGNPRRGLLVGCRREDGSDHLVSAAEVFLEADRVGAQLFDVFRRWSGREVPRDKNPWHRPRPVASGPRPASRPGLAIDLSRPVDLVVLSVTDHEARCRLPGSDQVLGLRVSFLAHLVPGELATVQPRKSWVLGTHPYLSGELLSTRLDVSALGLPPLGLYELNMWNPDDECWGEEDEPVEAWAEPIIARGPRPAYQMEPVRPGADDGDPIGDALASNDCFEAYGRLMALLQADLRCLDAHAYLGNLCYDRKPSAALRHYEVGVRVGELSLPPGFDGVLPWGLMDNRPFLRCLHGYGLCLWRLGRFDEALPVFERLLWLNPSDNQGVRLVIDDVRAGVAWKPDDED